MGVGRLGLQGRQGLFGAKESLDLGASLPQTAQVGSTGQYRELHFLVSMLQLLVIYRGNNIDPVCPEIPRYLKPITALHSCY